MRKNQKAMTLALPYDDDKRFNILPYGVYVRIEKPGDVVHPPIKPHSKREEMKFLPDGYVSVVANMETGEEYGVYREVGARFVERIEEDYDRSLVFLNAKCQYKKHIAVIMNDILVIREYRFHVFQFNPNGNGFYETKRFCFAGDNSWMEDRQGNVREISKYLVAKSRGCVYDFGNMFEGCRQEDLNRILPVMFSARDLNKRWASFSWWLGTYMGTCRAKTIYSYVPEAVRNYLTGITIDDLQNEILQEGNENFYVKKISDEFVVVFTKTAHYVFEWNFYRKQWVSVTWRRAIDQLGTQLVIFQNSGRKTGTVADKFTGNAHVVSFFDLHKILENPLYEKLYKCGFDNLKVKNGWDKKETEIQQIWSLIDAPENRNLSVAEFLGTTSGNISILAAEKYDLLSFAQAYQWMHEKAIREAIPDVRDRTVFVARLNKLYTGEMLLNKVLAAKDACDCIRYMQNISKDKNFAHMITQYADYRTMIDEANEYQEYLETLGLPKTIYPLYPKLSSLHHWHDLVNRDCHKQMKRKSEEMRLKRNVQIQAFCSSDEYLRYLYADDQFCILPVRCEEDLIREGELLSHCVGTYGPKVAERESYIYFIRRQSDPNIPYFTAEIRNDRRHRKILSQCYTYHDSIAKSSECKEFIRHWAEERKINIACTI